MLQRIKWFMAYGQDRFRKERHLKYTEQIVRTADRESSFIRFGCEVINPCPQNIELVYYEVTQSHRPEGDTVSECIRITEVKIWDQEGNEG
jgi:hypothetical protein